MGLYADVIFPRALDWVLGAKQPMRYRRQLLSQARGDVLEIGFGTALNVSCYPAEIERLTLVDPARMLPKRVQRRVDAAPVPVEMAYLEAEQLPFDAGRFDTVVSTWTLCTIPEVVRALAEIRRVLKPSGQLLFLEHGRSSNAKRAAQQDRWNRVQQIVGCGCNLNRPIDRLITAAGLRIAELERFDMPGMPKLGSPHYLGAATPA